MVVGVVLLFWGMTDAAANNMKIYYSFSSILIVGGGTLAATLISFHLDQVMKAFQLFMIALRSRLPHPSEITTTLVGLAEKARKEGLLALEEETERIDDLFFKRGIQLVVDGTDPQLLKSILKPNWFFWKNATKKESYFRNDGQFCSGFWFDWNTHWFGSHAG